MPVSERYFYQRDAKNANKEGVALMAPGTTQVIPIFSFQGGLDTATYEYSAITAEDSADTTGYDWMELPVDRVRSILIDAGFAEGEPMVKLTRESAVDQLRVTILGRVVTNLEDRVKGLINNPKHAPGSIEKLKRVNRDILMAKIQEKFATLKTYELEAYGETLMRAFNNNPMDLKTRIHLDAVRREFDDRLTKSGVQSEYSQPSPLLAGFEDSLFNIEEFTNGLVTRREIPEAIYEAMSTRCDSVQFRIQPHQVFLREYLAPGTPQRGVLIFHGTGAMKTCTGIQIAEAWLEQRANQDKRAYILAPGEVQDGFAREIWKPTENRSAKCTGDLYDTMREEIGGSIPNLVKSRQSVKGYVQFVNPLKKILGDRSVLLSRPDSGQVIRKQRDEIHRTFDNGLLIIDEAHNIRSGGEGKLVPPFLEDIVRIANNLTLVMMTATPMQNEAAEIVDVLNLLRLNDRRGPVILRDIFRANGTLQEGYKEKLESVSRGYVSQQRGSNPIVFSTVLMMGDRERPATTIFGEEQNPEVNLERFGVEISGTSVQGVKIREMAGALDKPESIRSFVQSKTFSQASDIVYPGGAIGDEGFDAVFARVAGGAKNRQKQRDSTLRKQGRFLREDEGLRQYSAKFVEILRAAQECRGIVLIFTQQLKACAIPLAIALEEVGFEAYGGAENNLLVDEEAGPRDVLDARPDKPRLSEVRGQEGEGDFMPARQALLTGEDIGAANREIIEVARSPENVGGGLIKVLIGTRVIMEGVDFQNLREIHVMEPWFNLSLLKQVIGRGSRFCSHKMLPVRWLEGDGMIESERNCAVYIHAGRVDGVACSDDIILDVAEEKAKVIVDVTKTLKGSAVDCNLFHEVNSQPREAQDSLRIRHVPGRGEVVEATFGDVPGSLECDFMENCEYACVNNVEVADRENSPALKQYSLGRGIIGGAQAINELLGREFYESPVHTKDHIVTALMKILRTTRSRVMAELMQFINTRRQFNVPPTEEGVPVSLTIRKFADGSPDRLVIQGQNAETGDWANPHDTQEAIDVRRKVLQNVQGRISAPSVADRGDDAVRRDFGILDKIWESLGAGVEVWTDAGTFGAQFEDLGAVQINRENQQAMGFVPDVAKRNEKKALGKERLKERKVLAEMFETFFIIAQVAIALGIPLSVAKRAVLLRLAEFSTQETRWEFIKDRLRDGGEELDVMTALETGGYIMGLATNNKGNMDYLVYRGGDGLLDREVRSEMGRRVFAEATGEWRSMTAGRVRRLERGGLNQVFGFENLRGFKAEKREEFNLIDQSRQRGRGRACNLTDFPTLEKQAADIGVDMAKLGELMSVQIQDKVKGGVAENITRKKRVQCVALELSLRHQDRDGQLRGEPRMFFNLDEDDVVKKALAILGGKA